MSRAQLRIDLGASPNTRREWVPGRCVDDRADQLAWVQCRASRKKLPGSQTSVTDIALSVGGLSYPPVYQQLEDVSPGLSTTPFSKGTPLRCIISRDPARESAPCRCRCSCRKWNVLGGGGFMISMPRTSKTEALVRYKTYPGLLLCS